MHTNNFKTLFTLLAIAAVVTGTSRSVQMPVGKEYTNSLGMKFVRIEPDTFGMGVGDTPLPSELLVDSGTHPDGDYDESPNHNVTISRPFYMGIFEVTNFQYELFAPDHNEFRRGSSKDDDDAVVQVTWYDAQKFCRWLSNLEGLTYRLPTEAEWEYACRAGTKTHFHAGDTLPDEFSNSRTRKVGRTQPNPWGIYDMHGNVEEWCYDWYGPYQAGQQTDSVGRATGVFRVTRGSHTGSPYYMRSANRIGNVAEDKNDLIGFRIVIGQMPKTNPLPKSPLSLYQKNVKQDIPEDIAEGPDPEKPYFKGPRKFTHLPDTIRGPLYNKHNHFTSVTQCHNGDLLAIWHTCISESGRELAVAGSRLRYGEENWEPASLFWDSPDRNDHGHALWYDGQGKIYHFQGLADLTRNVSLVMRTSSDNGLTWSMPRVIADHGPSRMPIESVFRTKEGYYVISCDKGPNIAWISRDEGLTWTHPGGSIRGKHAPVVQLSDGRLFSLGRQADIDGKMPMSISSDMGKTWEYSASEFQPVSWGQRAVLLRLKEGPVLFVSFCKKMPLANDSGARHYVSGLHAAVSYDDAKTWPHKRLVTDDGPERDIETLNGELIKLSPHNSESVGYLAICQTPDRLIHVLTSRQHYTFNLKWAETRPPAAPEHPVPPQAQQLPQKQRLAKVYSFGGPEGRGRWSWQSRDFTEDFKPDEPFKLSGGQGRGFYERTAEPDGFAAVDPKNGFTVELKARLLKAPEGTKGIDIELYDGGSARYAMAVTDTGLYWYEGYIQGSNFLAFDQFRPVADGLDNTNRMHTYRLAVRPDRVAQIYIDGELIGTRPFEYRTPRDAYIQLGADKGAEALIEYYAYDLSGAYQP